MKQNFITFLKAIAWLLFGFLIFIIQWKKMRAVFYYSKESNQKKYEQIALISMILFTLFVNMLVWLAVYLFVF